MNSAIVDREEIKLNDTQTKMVISGWGEEVYESSAVEKITYISDGLKVKGYLSYPKSKSKSYPIIIWNRGGFKDKGAIDKFTARGMFGQLASWGYVVLASQYRGNAGGEGEEEFGGKDVNDILNLVTLIEELSFADKSKMGIEGWSRGGMMSLLTLMKYPDFKCAVLIGAISNLRDYLNHDPAKKSFYENFFGIRFNEEVSRRTIIDKINKLPKIPYLIIHGQKDETVPPDQSIEISKVFSKLGIFNKLTLYEEGNHFLKTYRKEVDEQRKQWYEEYLK